MGDKINNPQEFQQFIEERQFSGRLRNAIGYCKNLLEIKSQTDQTLKYEERLNFERCLTENFLVKKGYDYFGKRDLIYVDLYGTDDIIKSQSI